MLSEKLKENTKINHQVLEGKLLLGMKLIRSKSDYANLLSLFYSFFGGLEIIIEEHLINTDLLDYANRRKVRSLANDLVFLQKIIPAFAGIEYLPKIDDHFQALGALYVLEGSTLGGTAICKMLKGPLNIKGFEGMSFFYGYGEETMPMWKIFKSILDLPIYISKQESIIQSANDTFKHFSLWFDEYSF